MDLNEYKNIWVFMEHDDGKVKNVGLELINESKKMAEKVFTNIPDL